MLIVDAGMVMFGFCVLSCCVRRLVRRGTYGIAVYARVVCVVCVVSWMSCMFVDCCEFVVWVCVVLLVLLRFLFASIIMLLVSLCG